MIQRGGRLSFGAPISPHGFFLFHLLSCFSSFLKGFFAFVLGTNRKRVFFSSVLVTPALDFISCTSGKYAGLSASSAAFYLTSPRNMNGKFASGIHLHFQPEGLVILCGLASFHFCEGRANLVMNSEVRCKLTGPRRSEQNTT